MTDLLTNTLLVFSLFIAVTTLVRAMNSKPPVINLGDSQNYRFSTGSYTLTEGFKQSLHKYALPLIERTVRCYGIDTIELIGHTDGTPAGGSSNLDRKLSTIKEVKTLSGYAAGSNADLGLLRALAVKSELESLLSNPNNHVSYRVLSGASLIGKNGALSPARNENDLSRRRIEVRFFRMNDAPFLPKCS
ncbi:hypothetical protein KQ313_05160 [Synechococcus sp. CS-1325]|uniref:hypothetical protein n=1 Tax=unclassified Synechococcus TaxID=2626047 RepID=UPI0021A8EFC9|nr:MULTISPECIES: hypothetical protein [unclassified Synechococcus]MCT0199064.1 hypothetical protein [Synechococcus sp. CS-1325]MCT0212534.1 hypothetical protein [Synechococcus sp. CS-1326]MCT0232050.1 hypothetical protein [Synechococcus sp. CS-1327]